MLALAAAAEFPSKGFVQGFRKFAKLAKAAVLLLVLKGVADGLVSGPLHCTGCDWLFVHISSEATVV